MKNDDVFKKEDEKAKIYFARFPSKYPKVQVKRQIPLEPASDGTIRTEQFVEQEFYVITSDKVKDFVQNDINSKDTFIVDSWGQSGLGFTYPIFTFLVTYLDLRF